MEERSWMQKKKPSFQVIPNYGINGVTNWNESKEVARTRAARILACATAPTVAGFFRTRDSHRQAITAIARLSRICTILIRKWCDAIAVDLGLRQPCSLNIQAKYETLAAGRPDSLS
jgi:hypothetical protein